MLFKLRYLFAIIAVILLFHNPHRYHVNPINNNEWNRLSQEMVLTNLQVLRHPKWLYKSDPGLMLIHSNWMFNYFLKSEYRFLRELNDDHDIIISDFQENPIRQSVYLGYGIYYHYIYKFQWDRIVQRNQDVSKPEIEQFQKVPVIKAIDLFNIEQDSRDYWYSLKLKGLKDNGFKIYLHYYKIDHVNSAHHLETLNQFNQFKSNEFIKFNSNSIKIFQISDLHYLNGQIDSITETFIVNSITKEQPHLIVINGDIIDFKSPSGFSLWPFSSLNSDFLSKYQLQLMLLSTLNLFIKFKIPYIINFGDSDYEFDTLNWFMLEFISNLPYCLNYVPSDSTQNSIHGLTNYNFNLYLSDNTRKGVISLLDTYKNDIESNQVNNIYRFNNNEKALDDKKNDKKPEETGNLKPDDLFKLCFIHYPLPNFRPTGKFKIIGSYNKFDKLITNTDKSYINDFLNNNYHVISASHEHENDGCILYNREGAKDGKGSGQSKIWLCYSSVTGGQAITKEESLDRKLRVFEITEKKLLSWKISESTGNGFDYQLIHEYK